jgi:hypothetical protein
MHNTVAEKMVKQPLDSTKVPSYNANNAVKSNIFMFTHIHSYSISMHSMHTFR